MTFELETYICPDTKREYIMSPEAPQWPLFIVCFVCLTSVFWISGIMYLSLKFTSNIPISYMLVTNEVENVSKNDHWNN